MTRRSWLLRCYPPGWRERYGDDLGAYLDDTYAGRLPLRATGSLVTGGLRERVRSVRALGIGASAGDRMRSGALIVLAAWAAFVVAGASFAKLSEHFDTPLSDRTRTIPDLAYAALQAVATLSGLAVIAGLVLAFPALLRFLSGGGWRFMRRHVVRASAATALAAAMTVALGVWAHQLTATQRNGGSRSYAAAFVVWASLVVVTTALWTVTALATARRLNLSRLVLLSEGALATGATVCMLVMVLAAAAWWGAMAQSAPGFLNGDAFAPTSPWNPQLIGTVGLMVAALAAAVAGTVRIIRAAPAVVSVGQAAAGDR